MPCCARPQACPPGSLKPHIEPFINYSPLNFFGIIFCMMVGTASLPHILMRYFTTPSVREARQSVAWSLFFIFLLYFSAPAYAAFSKLEVYTNIIGRDLDAIRPWMFTWGELGLIQNLRQERRQRAGGRRGLSGDRRPSRHRALAGFRHQHRRDRALHPRDCGPALCNLRAGGGRRPGSGALHRRRAPARHRQRAQSRHLLQDARPERADHPSPNRGASALVFRRRGFGRACRDQAGGYPGHGGVGVLACDGRQLPSAGHGHLVETRDLARGQSPASSPVSAFACSIWS